MKNLVLPLPGPLLSWYHSNRGWSSYF